MDPRFVPHTERVIRAEIARASREKRIVPEPRRIKMTDQDALLHLDIREVLTDQVEVVDDRKR